jgi:hypothetical protein
MSNSAGDGGGVYIGGTATLSDCTLSDNSASDSGGGVYTLALAATLTDCTFAGNSAALGGGLANFFDATLTNCTFSDNTAIEGGGISNTDIFSSMTLTNCTLSGNSTTADLLGDPGSGGGLFNSGIVTLINCTVSSNSAELGSGGGICNQSVSAFGHGTATLSNCTFSGNSAGEGGGIFNNSLMTLNNTIVANSPSGGDVVTHTALMGSHNLIEDGSGGLPDTLALDPDLSPLADNGGPTLTRAPLPGSPAINAGDNALAVDENGAPLAFDQRGPGFARLSGAAVDIGAFEFQLNESLVVTTTLDEDNGTSDPAFDGTSLREASHYANIHPGPDVITFDPTVFSTPQTITLTLGELPITDSLTITRPAAGLTISGNNASRIFNIDDGNGATAIDVQFTGLTLTAGKAADEGGAIRNVENLTLTDSTLSGNSAQFGGGLFNDGSAALTNCTLSDNSTGLSGASGAIYNSTAGAVTLTICTLSHNRADDGGGVMNFATAMLTNCTLSFNDALGNFSDGGGVYNLRSAVLNGCTLTFNDCGQSGGGIFNSGSALLTNCTLAENGADVGGGLDSMGTSTLTNCTLTENHTDFEGGGIFADTMAPLTLTNCTLWDNYAGSLGDELYNNGNVTLNNSIVAHEGLGTGDIVNFGVLAGSHNLVGDGSGGLPDTLTGDPMLAPLADNGGPTPTLALLAGSPAIDTGSDALVPSGVTSDGRGAPFTRFSGTVDLGAYERQTLHGLKLVVNTTADEGYGDYRPGDLSLREAIGLANGSIGPDTIRFDPTVFATQQTITLTLGEMAIRDSVAINGPRAALTISGNHASGIFSINDYSAASIDVKLTRLTLTNGGGYKLSEGGISNFENLTLSYCVLSNNTHDPGGGGLDNAGTASLLDCTLSGNSGRGGAIYNSGDVALTRCILSDNSALEDGGALYNAGTMRLTHCTLSHNSAHEGGSVFSTGTATLTNCTLSDNRAVQGGGLYVSDGLVALTDCILSNNSSIYDAGCLLNQSQVKLTDCTLSHNSSGRGNGGALDNSGVATLTGCTLLGNLAYFGGGGVYNFGPGTASLSNCTLANNSAIDKGGGLFTESLAPLTLTNCTESGNSAGQGGGLFSTGTVTLNNTIVADSPRGGDIFNTGALSGSHNLVQDGSGGLADTITGDPRLGPLANHGGPTLTQALLPGSPALNAGANALSVDENGAPLAFDQRGPRFPRVVGGTVDIGAFELQRLPPSADAGGPYRVNEGSSMALDASATTDTAQDPATLRYQWDFDGDGQFDDATGRHPTFSAANLDGFIGSTVTVRLRVTDSYGLQSFDTATINIDNVAPTAHVTGPSTGVRGQPRSFILNASDPAAADRAAGFTYAIDFDGNGRWTRSLARALPNPSRSLTRTPGSARSPSV